MNGPPLHILGLGATTSLGPDVPTSVAASRAGRCGFAEHPYMVDTAGEPMRVARVPWLQPDLEGVSRYEALLLPAIDQALASIPDVQAVPMALCLPSSRPGRPADLSSRLRRAVASHFGDRLCKVICFEYGHAGVPYGLDAAWKSLRAGSIEHCIVAGVDTYLQAETLEWLEQSDQLHSGGALNNAWGFIPGEAAGAVLIGSHAPQPHARSHGQILAIGLAQETKLIKSEDVCIGEGLTQAFRQAFQSLPAGSSIDNIFCDMNGEAYRADEYGFTALRTKDRFRRPTDFIAPADCWGDVGAAGAALHLAMAAACCANGYGHGPLSLVWASSEGGQRGAVIVQAPFVARE